MRKLTRHRLGKYSYFLNLKYFPLWCSILASPSSSGDSGSISESGSGKSSPGTFPDHPLQSSEGNDADVIVSPIPSPTALHQQHQMQQQNKTNLDKLSSHLLLDDQYGSNNSLNGVGLALSSALSPNDTSELLHTLGNGVSSNSVIDTSRFSKLGLFDDNNSFFSTNTFQPYFKMEHSRNSETNNTNSPQLPDLLNGTDTTNKDRQEIDKLNLLKGIGEFNSQMNLQQGYNTTG